MTTPPDDAAIFAIERPDARLWKYYLLQCLVFPPLFPFLFLPAWFKYSTLRYTFSAEGISMRWGILFRREIIIQYARIQDIHLRSNMVERWLGLARILVQTASGNAQAEMTLEGLPQTEAIRDFLYQRMRGVKEQGPVERPASAPPPSGDELAGVLHEVVVELREIRRALESRGGTPGEGASHV